MGIFKDKKVKVNFTKEQQDKCTKFGSTMLAHTEAFMGEYGASLPKRHAGMLLRIASTLCLIRHYEHGEIETEVLCADDDFYTSLFIIETSIKNSIQLFNTLPGESTGEEYARKNVLWKALPDDFTTAIVSQTCSALNITERTSSRYLKDFISSRLLKRKAPGIFTKTTTGTDGGRGSGGSDGGGGSDGSRGSHGNKTNYKPNLN